MEVHYNWLSFSMLLSVENTYIQKCYFSFFFLLFFLLFFSSAVVKLSYKLPQDLKSQHSLGCGLDFSHMSLVAGSVRMILVHLIFKPHSGTDVFCRDCKMKFRNKGAWVMFWYNMVRDHCMKLILADNHNLSLWKLAYTICV